MSPLVSPAWVAERLREPGLVLLDATLPPVGVKPVPDVRARYLEMHLPGAVFFDIEALSDKETMLPHMLPTPERFASEMAELGVGEGMRIVVYEQAEVFSAPRAWWMLRSFGVERVYVLDGGLQGWVEAGLPTEAGAVQRESASFAVRPKAGAVTDLAQLRGKMANGAQILDARSDGRFRGTAPEPRAGIRSGHMPGAVNVPYTELIRANQLRSAEEIRAVFAERQVDFQQPITTTCGSGVTAAVLALGLEICGAEDVSLYDGSWAEYAQQPDARIETDVQLAAAQASSE